MQTKLYAMEISAKKMNKINEVATQKRKFPLYVCLMSYKTTKVSNALLVIVAFYFRCIYFFLNLTVSALFIGENYISHQTWNIYAQIQVNRSID